MRNSRRFSLCSLVVLSLFLQQGEGQHPDKSEKWKDLGGDFNYIIETEDEVIWTDAVYNCFTEGGTLASFHSIEEVRRIVKYMKKQYDRLHIGLYKHNDGSFDWVDKSAFDFRNWAPREPSYRETRREPIYYDPRCEPIYREPRRERIYYNRRCEPIYREVRHERSYPEETCAELIPETGKWNDIRCHERLGYICSTPKDQPPRESGKVCPDVSPRWNDFGGEFCYIIEKDNHTTWHDALRQCSEEGGSLASFHSVEDVSVVLQHTQEHYERMHIGLLQSSDGRFQWADKSPFDLEFWDSGEPNDIDERCGEMYPQSGQWNDIPCDKNEGYICSTPKVNPGISSLEATELPSFPSPGSCGGEINTDSGTINSPNYPENYGPNENCVWKISVPENFQISLSFHVIEVEYDVDCKFDYIGVLDGPQGGRPVLQKICGSEMPRTVLSSGNEVSVKFVSDGTHEDVGFTVDFTKVELCGGNIVSDEGTIQSRNYPEHYLPNEKCIWKIKIPDNNKILLSFKSFETEEDSDCVEVLDGHDPSSSSLGRYCGSNIPSDIVSSGHKITVKFTSDFLKEYPGFSAEFKKAEVSDVSPIVELSTDSGFELGSGLEEECDTDIVAERGIITSPNYPREYESSQRCTWRITVPDNYQVILKFKAFSLESSVNCNYDEVTVFDGHEYSSGILGEFCGLSLPDDVISSSNKMTVKFSSDSSGEYRGFAAVFSKGHGLTGRMEYRAEQEATCGESIESEEGVIQSPNYPENYGPNERCDWRITVPEGHQIVLKFSTFNIEIHDDCNYDYVEIRDGETSRNRIIARLCGSDIPEDIRSSGNKLTISFNSDSSSEYSGFSAEFKKVTPDLSNITAPESVVCGGDIHSDNGTIESPNYPENYPPFATCTWTITALQDEQIVLEFQSLEIEYGNICEFDSVIVYDGHESGSPVLGTFCGTNDAVNDVIRSSENKLMIKFFTDDSFESSGFSATFRKAKRCGERISAEEGVIQSRNYPDNYNPGEYCIWRITVPGNDNRIFLTFQTFEVEYSSSCSDDAVTVYDGNDTTVSILGTFCGHGIPEGVVSSGNQMTVKFASDLSEEGKGFAAEFKIDFCGGDIVADSGTISSRNYPSNYRNNEFCTWNITVPEHHQVFLIFEAFNVESSDQCMFDYVKVRDGHEDDSPVLGKFCGRDNPGEIRSSAEKMAVTFRTDSSVQYSGFKATFTKDICGGDLDSDSGYISSPNYPGLYGKNSVCVWNITVPENHQVVLYFQQFDMEVSDGCEKDFLEILDGHGSGSPVLAKVCGRVLPSKIRSSTEKMSLRFVSDDSYEGHGFFAKFAKVAGCIYERESTSS